MSAGPAAREAAPPRFVNQHLTIPRDLHRRVAAFAEANGFRTNARAYRRLIELALTELERSNHE